MECEKCKKDLTIKNLSDIIKTCRKYGVLKLSYCDCTIELDPEANYLYRSNKVKEVSPELVAQVEGETLLRQELAVRQSQHEQMIIDDPQGYEKLLAEGELGGNVETEYNEA